MGKSPIKIFYIGLERIKLQSRIEKLRAAAHNVICEAGEQPKMLKETSCHENEHLIQQRTQFDPENGELQIIKPDIAGIIAYIYEPKPYLCYGVSTDVADFINMSCNISNKMPDKLEVHACRYMYDEKSHELQLFFPEIYEVTIEKNNCSPDLRGRFSATTSRKNLASWALLDLKQRLNLGNKILKDFAGNPEKRFWQ